MCSALTFDISWLKRVRHGSGNDRDGIFGGCWSGWLHGRLRRASGKPTKSTDGFLVREKSTFFQRSIREANWRPGVGRLVTWSTVNDRGRERRMRRDAGDPDARNVIAARPFSPILGDPRGLSRSPRGWPTSLLLAALATARALFAPFPLSLSLPLPSFLSLSRQRETVSLACELPMRFYFAPTHPIILFWASRENWIGSMIMRMGVNLMEAGRARGRLLIRKCVTCNFVTCLLVFHCNSAIRREKSEWFFRLNDRSGKIFENTWIVEKS